MNFVRLSTFKGDVYMSDILYVQTEKNVEVHQPEVYLQDVAKLSSSSTSVLNRNRVRKVFTIPDGKPGRYVISALELVEAVQDKEQTVDVTHMGETNIVITYETQKHKHVVWSWAKTVLVCFLTFFGGAFSIMTFNMDVDTSGLFFQIYKQLTGNISTGHTILVFTYSLGIGLGVVFFFNHFGHGKITQDPTPMEVQMRVYEDDVDKTLIEKKNRKEKN